MEGRILMPGRRLFVPNRFEMQEARSLDEAAKGALRGRFGSEVRKEFSGKCLEASTVVTAVLQEEGYKAALVSGLMSMDSTLETGERFVLNHAWVDVDGDVIDLVFPDVMSYYKPGETLPAFGADEKVVDLEVPENFVPPWSDTIVGKPPAGVAFDPRQPLNLSQYLAQPWGTRTVREMAKKYRLRFRKLSARDRSGN